MSWGIEVPEIQIDPPPTPPYPRCPVCDSETDTFYQNKDGDIVGCDECVTTVDAWEATEEDWSIKND